MAKKEKKSSKGVEFSIEIPEGIECSVEGNTITMKKDSKELKKILDKDIKISKEGNKIALSMSKSRRAEKRRFGTAKSHLKNMTEGLTKGWEYELEICNIHFPITVTFDKAKSEFIIKNILGEKCPRTIKAAGKVEVEIKAPHIKIKSHDLEAAGQTAANLEKITRIRYRDRNKFQDGIFITKKPGIEYI